MRDCKEFHTENRKFRKYKQLEAEKIYASPTTCFITIHHTSPSEHTIKLSHHTRLLVSREAQVQVVISIKLGI